MTDDSYRISEVAAATGIATQFRPHIHVSSPPHSPESRGSPKIVPIMSSITRSMCSMKTAEHGPYYVDTKSFTTFKFILWSSSQKPEGKLLEYNGRFHTCPAL